MSLLDNPIWSSLTSRHAFLAESLGGARRYPSAIAPFAAIADLSLESGRDLKDLVRPQEQIGMIGLIPEDLSQWVEIRRFDLFQYTFSDTLAGEDSDEIQLLDHSHVEAMLELVALVYPAYFRRGTAELGPYVGIVREGRLAAMAGIRMAMSGHQEISAVCTHPDFRGQGLARRLTARLVSHIQGQGDVPILHTEWDNYAAQSIYASLGFHHRATLPVAVLQRKP